MALLHPTKTFSNVEKYFAILEKKLFWQIRSQFPNIEELFFKTKFFFPKWKNIFPF
jgi:hypothetical protein